jgi:hypothetical protein
LHAKPYAFSTLTVRPTRLRIAVAGWLVVVLVCGLPVGAAAQSSATGAPFGGAMDDHFRRDAARGEGRPSRAFAFAAQVEAAAAIERVDEQRQARGAPRFAISLRNNSAATIPSVEMLALVVGESGSVTAVQPVPPVKDLKGRRSTRVEHELRGVAFKQTDRLAFVIAKITTADDVWTAPEADLREMAAEAARALFPPR